MQYSAGFFIVFEALSRENIQRVCDRGSNEEDDKKDKLDCIGYCVPGPKDQFVFWTDDPSQLGVVLEIFAIIYHVLHNKTVNTPRRACPLTAYDRSGARSDNS